MISLKEHEKRSSKYSSFTCSRNIPIVKGNKPFKFLRSSFRLYQKTKEQYIELIKKFKIEVKFSFLNRLLQN